MQKIVTYLWFDNQAEEAMEYYTSLFPDSKVVDATPGPDGKVMVGTFQLAGQEFIALNGGPQFKFNEAISLLVRCQNQAEVDWLWDKLVGDGGEESSCGWLKDRFGLSWQIIPNRLGELIGDPDRGRAGRAIQAMLGMKKIDIAGLERAASGT
jgi:predicted 3-demethylubiquinone-9 3-methyltransferase (glyoxalase superfamily)